MSRLRLMCGLAGAGKSTHAGGLEADGWVRFSIDRAAWELGYRAAAAIPPGVAAEIRAQQRSQIAAALGAGHDVVVDYSFWSRAQRDEYRALGRRCRAVVDVVFLDVPEPMLRSRLRDRLGRHEDDFVVAEELFDEYVRGFERPGPDELDVLRLAPGE